MQVLIVEDHENSCEELKRCLAHHGHDVTAAGDLQSAVQSLGKGPFDAIISDIALPDGTGYAFINRVHRRGLDPLCIAVSGYTFPTEVDEPGLTGFHYHLQKPLDCNLICTLLEKNADPGSREKLLNAFSARHR
jgi:CheY-like chemotaxis protein